MSLCASLGHSSAKHTRQLSPMVVIKQEALPEGTEKRIRQSGNYGGMELMEAAECKGLQSGKSSAAGKGPYSQNSARN